MKSSGNRAPLWAFLLSAVVAIQLLAMAKPILWEDGSDLYRYATKQVDLSQAKEDMAASSLEAIINGTATATELSIEGGRTTDEQSQQQLILRIDRGVAYFLIFVGIVALFVRRRSLIVASLLLIVGGWCVADSIAAVLNGGKAYSGMTPYSLAARSVMPFLLALLLLFLPKSARVKSGNGSSAFNSLIRNRKFLNVFDIAARLALASTFLVHGYKAVQGHYPFRDLVNLSARRIGLEFSTDSLLIILKVIGYQDILLAVFLLITRSRFVLYWTAIWGCVTAFSRVTALGFPGVDLWLVRSANGGLALVLIALYWWFERGGNELKISQKTPMMTYQPL